jgi:hypothetical protein
MEEETETQMRDDKKKRMRRLIVPGSILGTIIGVSIATIINSLHVRGASDMDAMISVFLMVGCFFVMIIYKIKQATRNKKMGRLK